MALTYENKIEPVRSGKCIQTIRKGWRVSIGDEILFHNWSGRPYASKWGWRLRVVITDVYDLMIDNDIVTFSSTEHSPDETSYAWDSYIVDAMAIDDYINPPTGKELKNILIGLNGKITEKTEYQIIRWKIKDAATL